jgi:hypothetical protein
MVKEKKYEFTIKEAQELLSENKTEWLVRYTKYASDILLNIDNEYIIKKYKKQFNEFPPLLFYISTTRAKENIKNRLFLDIRYGGQSVATLKITSNDVTISTKDKDEKNLENFNCNIELPDNTPWRTTEATNFRKYFRERVEPRNKTKGSRSNEEHNVESLLLTEFSKRGSKDKAICGIQPIKIFDYRFGMPTPISACNHKGPLKYSKQYGGGIDIFARTGNGRHSTYLTVIEVKDENKKDEPPTDALKQAIQYAVFIRELLRSDCGADWYKIFGFKGEIPKQLTIRVACAMPAGNNPDISFEKRIYEIGNDIIECHYIYFKYDGKKLSNFITSLNK